MKINFYENILCAALGIGLVAGCASTHQPAKPETATSTESGQMDARTLFAENCARCHGADGRANTFRGFILRAQNFTYPQWQTNTSDAEIINAIQTGPKGMPSFADKLSDAQIKALAAYVRTFQPANKI